MPTNMIGTASGSSAPGTTAPAVAASSPVSSGVSVGLGPPGFVGSAEGGGGGVTHGTTFDGSGVGGPPPGSSQTGGWNSHTWLGGNRPPQVRPKGTRKPSKK